MTDNQIDPNTDSKTRYYTQRAIAIATFLGGPLAAGILVRQNFINSGKDVHGKYALIIGIVSTVLLFAGIISLTETTIDKIPNAIIPVLYTGIIYLIVEWLQGKSLRAHKENNGQFYSGWNAAGLGAICMVIIIACLFGYAYLAPEDFNSAEYNNGISEFHRNEELALRLYTLLDMGDEKLATEFIQETGIPAWQENIQILNELDTIEGLHEEFIELNKLLREYCQLRIELYEFIKKALTENSIIYDQQIQEISNRINELINQL